MRAVPRDGAKRPGNVHAAQGADCFGQGQALRHGLQVLPALGRIGIQQIAPAAHFGYDHVVFGKRLGQRANPVCVLKRHARAIGGSIAKLAMRQRQRLGVIGVGIGRPA